MIQALRVACKIVPSVVLLLLNLTVTARARSLDPDKNVFIDAALSLKPEALETVPHTAYLVTHGRPAQLLIEGAWLQAPEIALYVQQKGIVKTGISSLNILGCEFGKGAEGRAAVAYLEESLGIAVAASDDITGRNGDWELEVGTYVSIKGLESYQGNLQYGASDDFDGDGIINSLDIDDDNDGVLDKIECPSFFTNMATTGGFSKAASSISNWYMGLASATLPITESFTPSTITISRTGDVYNYGTTTEYPGNSTLTGGYFDTYDGVNTATGVQYVMQEQDPLRPVVCDLTEALVGGAPYNYSFDLGNRSSGSTNRYIVLLYNKDTNTPEKIIEIGVLNTLPSVSSSPKYKNFTGTFTPSSSAHYSLLFYPSISGGAADDFAIDRVAIASASAISVCDIDGDGIPNYLDRDSDGDGCPDAKEAGTYNKSGVVATGDSVITNTVSGNGFADVLQAVADTNTYRYSYTYSYATSVNISSCADTDGDGIPDLTDIDDDNDGILDAVESPACYYTSLEWLSGVRSGISVSTDLAMNATYNAPGELVDGDNGTAAANYAVNFTATTTASPASVYQFTMPMPVQLDTVFLGYVNTNTHFNTGTILQLQGSGDGSTWTNLSDSLTYSNTVSTLGVTTVPGISGTQNANIFPVTKNAGRYSYYRIRWISGGGINASGYSNEAFFSTNTSYAASANPKLDCSADADGDGVFNHLDRDSDGDGCPDAREAGTYNRSGVTSTGDSVLTNTVSGNGFADVLQAVADTNAYRYSYTYSYVTSKNVNACADTDGDGIADVTDIDDDNDGVLDAVESPACFYTLAEAMVPATVSSSLTLSNIANINDANSTTTSAFTAANSQNATIIQLSPVSSTNLVASAVRFEMSAASSFLPTNNPGIQLQGWNGISWVNLSDSIQAPAISPAVVGGYVTVNVTKNSAAYNSYRLLGVASATANVATTAIREAQIVFNNYVPSAHAKLSCSTDTDGDGVFNHLDRDSDGDGCPDAKEAGTYNKAGVTSTGDSVLTNTVNGNGFADVLQATADTNAYQYSYTYAYAASGTINTCTDTDGDGIPDLVDIDDDNDGVLDAVEAPACYYTSLEWLSGVRSGITVSTGLAMNATYNAPSELVDGDNGTAAANYAVNFTATTAGNPATVYDFTMPVPVRLDTLFLGYVNTNTHFNTGTILQLQGSGDGSTWINLSDSLTYNTTVSTLGVTGVPGVSVTQNANIFPVTKNAGRYSHYRIRWISGGGINATGYSNEAFFSTNTGYVSSANPKLSCATDTDGDGITNNKDLDSDGDGCPDAKEAGVTANSGTSGFMSSSGGSIYTGGITSGTANAYVGNGSPSLYGANGFFNGIETGTESNIYNGSYTYTYGIDSTADMCIDTDGDGVGDLVDIDDDNDGILDVDEGLYCPSLDVSCDYITANYRAVNWTSVNATLNTAEGYAVLLTGDTVFVSYSGDARSLQPATSSLSSSTEYCPTSASSGATNMIQTYSGAGVSHSFTFSKPVVNPVFQVWSLGAGGTIDSSNVNAVTYKFTTPVDVLKSNGYLARIGTNYIVGGEGDGSIIFAGTQSSINFVANRSEVWSGLTLAIGATATASGGCSTIDTDGDGIPNHLDLDSDGDGCPDAKEAGTYNKAGVTSTGDSVLTNTVSGNGFVDVLQAVADTNAYRYSYTYGYATSASINGCADTDGDGIPDVADIDDDNDGILDAVEAPACYYAASEAAVPLSVSSSLTLNNIANINDANAATTSAFTAANSQNATIIRLTPVLTPNLAATAIRFEMNTTASFLPTNNPGIQLQGWNGSSWINLGDSIQAPALSPAAAGGYVTVNVTKNAGVYESYRLLGVAAATANVSTNAIREAQLVFSNYANSAHPKLSCTTDTDGDGILNQQDRDSDGDGCPDAKEAGTYNKAGVTTTGDSVLTNTVSINGFADVLQAVADTNAYRYTYTYNYATSGAVNACADTDGDGILDVTDIDDDNDGVLDAVEAPACYYSVAEASKIVSVSSQLASYSSTVPANTIDGNTATYNAFNGALDWVGKELYKFAATDTIGVPLKRVELDLINWALSNSSSNTFKLQGSYNNESWTDLSAPVASTAATGTFNLTNTVDTVSPYKYFRIIGVVGPSNYGGVTEMRIVPSTVYVPSANPKLSCTTDTDGDGITNNRDLDSDGDGCPDAKEAGTYNKAGVTSTGDSVLTNTVNGNGFADILQATADTNAYRYAYTYTYALSESISACTDTDGDGIPDLVDIDDDNDGVLDAVEAPACYYTSLEWLSGVRSGITVSTGLAMNATYNAPSELVDGDNGTAAANYAVNFIATTAGNPATVYDFTMPVPVRLDTLFLGYVNTNTHFNTGTILQLQGSGDGSTWINLSDSLTYNTTVSTLGVTGVPGVSVTQNANIFPVTKNAGRYSHYRIRWISGGGINASGYSNEAFFSTNTGYVASANPKLSCATDTDGDGITNNKDLDSDGDGCPDAKEAGTYSQSGVTSTGDSVLTNTVGGNGFADVLQATADTNTYRYTYSYHYAIDNTREGCTDTDGDGTPDLWDIDDDNDGVLDGVELNCPQDLGTYLSAIGGYDVYKYGLPTGSLTVSTASTNTSWATYIFNDSTELDATAKYLNSGNGSSISFGGAATNVLQTGAGFSGLTYHNGATDEPDQNVTIFRFIAPSDFKLSVPSVGASGDEDYAFVVNNVALIGPAGLYNGGGSSLSGGPFSIHEGDIVEFRYRNVTPVDYYGNATITASGGYFCLSYNLDTDGDGIPNHLDLDSDGDGCPDAKEAGTYNKAGVTSTGDSVLTNTASGNGFADVLQATADTNAYRYVYTYTYAISGNINTCTDTDGDGIPDLVDIDDDNDGVLDAVEAPTCYYTSLEWLSGVRSGITVSTGLAMNATYNAPSELVDGDNGIAAANFAVNFTATSAGSPATVYDFAMPVPVQLDTLFLGYYNTSTHFNASTVLQLQGSGDGSTWINLSDSLTYNTTVSTLGVTAVPGVSGTQNANIFPVTKNAGRYTHYRIRWISGGGINATGYSNEAFFSTNTGYVSSANPKLSCTTDTDGDGILNQQDLDSDGDGCPDAKEAGTYNKAGVTSTGDSVLTNTVNGNGFADVLQSVADTNAYRYGYSYGYAVSKNINACADTDGDGIPDVVDIDDDNDGILDAVEAPACYYTAAEAAVPSLVSSSLTLNNIANINDANAATTSAFTSANTQNATIIQLTPVVTTNLVATAIRFEMNTTTSFLPTNNPGIQLQGWNGSSWINLGDSIQAPASSPAAVGGYVTVNVTKNAGAYDSYRLLGVASATANVSTNAIREAQLVFSNYAASAHPKVSCTTDTDGDGIFNQQDLDSDGDGCPDAKEAGTYSKAGVTTTGDSVLTNTVNGNGFADVLQAVADTNTYRYTYTYGYATLGSFNACADTDGDGIPDVVDIDDDNDGILDAVEASACYYSVAEAGKIVSVSSQLASYSTNVPANTIDGNNATYNAFNGALDWVGKELYKFAATDTIGVPLKRVELDLTTWALSSSATNTFRLQGSSNNESWTDLSAPVSSTATTGTFNLTNTLDTVSPYKYFRIIGVVGSSYYGGVTEMRIVPSGSYAPSAHPKLSCATDTDGDGITNNRDLDSDGDGCPDAKEAGTYNKSGVTSTGDSVLTNTVSGNGFADVLQSAADTNAYTYTYTYSYATTAGIELCTDSDGDGVVDFLDIDDDNDGVLDVVEQICSPIPVWDVKVYDYTGSGTCSESNNLGTLTQYASGTMTYNEGIALNWQNPGTQTAVLSSLTTAGGTMTGTNPPDVSYAVFFEHTFNYLDAGTYTLPASVVYDGKRIIKTKLNGTDTTLFCTTDYTTNTPSLTVNFEPGTKLKIMVWENGVGNAQAVMNIQKDGGYPCNNKVDIDTDGDGIPNRLDLDSDDDGCYDAREAGSYNRAGVTTSGDSVLTNTVSGNGFADVLQATADTNTYRYAYTYNYALSNNWNLCADTDGDGVGDLFDIDDDNDGILDAVESPACFYTEKEMSQPASIATTMTIGAGDNVNSLIDTVLTGGFNFTAQALGSDTILTFSIKYPARLDTVAIQMNAIVSGTNGFGATGATAKVQAYNGSTWVDVSAATNINSTTLGRINFPITDTGKYLQYRLMGVATANSNTNTIGELLVSTKSPHVASLYPKPTCSNDTDNDGILNHLDLDSDGDGCTDAQEAGTYNMPGVRDTTGTVQNGEHTGTVTSSEVLPHAVIQGPYGANGFADSLQTASPGDTNSYRYTYNYSRATDSSVQACCATISGNTISADQTICYGAAADTIIGSTASASREGATVSYKWMSSTTSASSGFTLNGATGKDYLPGVLTASTWYKRVAVGDTCSSSTDTSSVVAITVSGLNAGGPDKNACLNGTVEMEATGSGTWTQVGTTPSVATIVSPTAANTTISDLTVAGTYRFVWTISDCTDTVSVNVRPLPNGTLSGSVICEGEPATLTFNATSGTGPFNLTISGDSYSDIISGTPFAPVSIPVTTTTYDLEYISDTYGCENP